MWNVWHDVVRLFREHMGTGLIVAWYLISIVYLFLKEHRKEVRVLFIYVPVIVLLLYFNPLFAWIVYTLAGSEIYYRILWLLPMTVSIAYTCVCIYGELKGGKKEIFAVCMAGILAASGSFIYSNPFFHEAENLYHVPDSVVEICDAIVVPGREVMAVFPRELLPFVRQYSPVTCMPYGREILVYRWNQSNELYEAMEAPAADLELLAPLVNKYQCHYVVLRQDREIIGKITDYNWEWFFENDNYVVYRNLSIPLVIPEGYALSPPVKIGQCIHETLGDKAAPGGI